MLPRGDPDRDYILSGVKHGFKLVDLENVTIKTVCTKNHNSALKSKYATETQIKEELAMGNYVVTDSKPDIVSALGSIPKDNGKVRLIQDGSMPHNAGIVSVSTWI